MRTLTYMLIGLFSLSLLFAGSSYAGSGKIATCSDFSKAMNLLGTTLYAPGGEYIGEVDDLAINPSTGRIDSVLVSRITGAGARVVAIPFDDISETGQHTFVYNPPYFGGYGELPYYAYRLNQLPPMPQGDHKFTELLRSSVQSMEGEECPA
jgi:sporulation protein YlmC with PRC-barrel domain